MTIRQHLISFLTDKGLWDHEAEIVVSRLVVEVGEPMQGRWEEESVGYPIPLLVTLRLRAATFALQWIDENKPRHWARRELELLLHPTV